MYRTPFKPDLHDARLAISEKVREAQQQKCPRQEEFLGRRTWNIPAHPFKRGGIRSRALDAVLRRAP